MSQESLFNARIHVRRAYESLVLAYAEHELQELEQLKNAVLRGLITVEMIATEQLALEDVIEADDEVQF